MTEEKSFICEHDAMRRKCLHCELEEAYKELNEQKVETNKYRLEAKNERELGESIVAEREQLYIDIESLKAITELNSQLTKRTVPDMSDLSSLAFKQLKLLWGMHGSAYLINVLRHMDYQDGIPDIFSPERFSINTTGDSNAQT
jgi:hypothetical protein